MPVLRCEFCGAEMPTKTAYGVTVPVPCQCDGAKAERERLDLEERRASWKAAYSGALRGACIPAEHNRLREWGDGSSCYLYGRQGRGKTERACGALRKWLKDGIERYDERGNRYYAARSGKYILMPEWMMHLRSTYDMRGVTEENEIQAMAGVGMLVMDDLGKGKMTEWVVERIYTILAMRYGDRATKRTVITTQYDLDSLTEIFERPTDEETALAIRSRIEGMCSIMRIEGEDMRKRLTY